MTAQNTGTEQVQAAPAVRVEVRIGGRLRFSNDVYSPSFDIGEDRVTFSADLAPTFVDKPTMLRPPTRFVDQTDPRDGEEIIQTVHSGRRDIVEPRPGRGQRADHFGVDQFGAEPRKAAPRKPARKPKGAQPNEIQEP